MTGGDAKYGRLFTEEDVRAILDIADSTSATALPDLEQIVEDLGDRVRFPVDEPLFLLRGQDVDALYGIEGYGRGVADEGHGAAHFAAVEDARLRFAEWQRAHPDRVKVPS